MHLSPRFENILPENSVSSFRSSDDNDGFNVENLKESVSYQLIKYRMRVKPRANLVLALNQEESISLKVRKLILQL